MITIEFNPEPLVKKLQGQRDLIRAKIEQILTYAGREAVSRQRALLPRKDGGTSYEDQSGNLRSSVGFVVTTNGQEVGEGGFEPKQGPEPQAESLSPEAAAQVGKEVATQKASQAPEYPTLTVVAGMNYASYVADKGLDVLSTARIVAEEYVRKGLEDLAR